jgi:flap endonuclease-1
MIAEAEADLRTAEEEGNAEEIEKLAKRTVKVSKTHNEEAKRLLRLMGVPVVEAPCEAEATCAALARAGLVFAAGSEDMDTLDVHVAGAAAPPDVRRGAQDADQRDFV